MGCSPNTVDSNLPALVKPLSSISSSRPRARANDRDALVRVLDESRFHLHVDCDRASPWLLEALEVAGYADGSFVRPDGSQSSPRYVRTLKVCDPKQFKREARWLTRTIQRDGQFVGFVETEVIVRRVSIARSATVLTPAPPFVAHVRKEPGGRSKQADLHVSLCASESDPRIVSQLVQMGLSYAFLPKPWGSAAVFSLQGGRRIIAEAFSALEGFLRGSGGAARCSIKEERIASLWVSGDDAPAMNVIDRIDWRYA